MSAIADDEFITGCCEWCGDEGEIYRDNHLCERCDNDTVHCSICDELQHRDDTCRHLFEDENFEWCGSGTGHATDSVKASFFALLQAMPATFSQDLRAAIDSSKFHTWLIAPMIGGGGVLQFYGMPCEASFKWGEALITLGEGDNAEDYADGYHWLASLFDDKTPEANAQTIQWIDEHVAKAEGRDGV